MTNVNKMLTKAQRNTIKKQEKELKQRNFKHVRRTQQVRVSLHSHCKIKQSSRELGITMSRMLDRITNLVIANGQKEVEVECKKCSFVNKKIIYLIVPKQKKSKFDRPKTKRGKNGYK